MIRRSVNHGGPPPADLLVCFPSRSAHLIPKKLSSSPARFINNHTFHHRHHQHHRNNNNQLKKLPSTRLTDQSSWDKVKKATTTGRSDDDASEPSSPKVTCAGQIKVRHNRSGSSSVAANCKSWQSVMEEIERIHKKSKNENKKKGGWGSADALGIKKDVMQFLTCLRNIKLDFRCFGAVPECDLSSDEEEEDEEEEEETDRNNKKKNIISKPESDKFNEEKDHTIIKSEKDSRRSMFSDWFMVVQDMEESEKLDPPPPPPPPNALLLMRCRSAPAKSWLENRAKLIVEQQEEEERDDHHNDQQQEEENEEEDDKEEGAEKGRKKLRDYLLVMEQYDTDFYKLSNDIAKETWVVGSINNPFTRSRSWKR